MEKKFPFTTRIMATKITNCFPLIEGLIIGHSIGFRSNDVTEIAESCTFCLCVGCKGGGELVATAVDTVIVGGGAMGSAAAWQLAKRGRDVVLLERFDQVHAHGASHGTTRNFNPTYRDSVHLRLVQQARELWRELESESGIHLLDLGGLTNHGAGVPDDHVDILRAAGISAEWISVPEARERWRGIAFDTKVLYTPDGGTVNPEASIRAFQAVAAQRGASIHHNTPVTAIRVAADDTAWIDTAQGSFRARRVIVTAGAWTNVLIGGIASYPRLHVTQEQPAHFRIVDEGAIWPSFNHLPLPGDPRYAYWPAGIYGMLTPGEGVKAGFHAAGPTIDPDHRDYRPVPTLTAALVRYAREYLPGVDPEEYAEISCTYTLTPDENFILDRQGPLVIGAGFSGHGYKFTPAIGRILADLATNDDKPVEPIFSARR